ncbi:hypothetical protein ABB02_01540 [Clostridiaceae bacterium JG1575]|nr:hypothetical protein ABB02_01540 [Clostridiaceae bacterium JG1575]
MYLPSLFSFIIYILLSLIIVLSGLYNALIHQNLPFAFLLLVVLVGLITGHFREYQLVLMQRREELKKDRLGRFDLQVVLAVSLATVLTFHLNNELHLGGVVASCLVGLLGPVLWPKQQRAIFCGSFAGMATTVIFTHYAWVLLSGLLAGLLLAFSREIYEGFGGKLGASGLFGTATAALLAQRFIFFADNSQIPTDYFLPLYFILGAVLTYHINKINHTGTILASSVVGLFAGLLLPLLHEPSGAGYAVAAFCGSFVGMTIIHRLTNEAYLFTASVMGSVIFLSSQVNFVGLGGKLGTTAFAAVISWWGLMFLYDMALEPGRHEPKRPPSP